MRRRILSESDQGFQPYYSDYPVFTEYGTYWLTPQGGVTGSTNSFVKLDETCYSYCGGCVKSREIKIVYTQNSFVTYYIHENGTLGKWFTKEQESKTARFKACMGGEEVTPEVEYYVEKEA